MDISVFWVVVGGVFSVFLGLVLACLGLDWLWNRIFPDKQSREPKTLGEQIDSALHRARVEGREEGYADGERAGYDAGYSAGYGTGVNH